MSKVTVLYRYERSLYSVMDDEGYYDPEKEPKVELRTFRVAKETPKCYFIFWGSPNKLKRCLKDAKSTFAYDTKEKALENYKHRCRRALGYCRFNLKVAERFNEHAKTLSHLKAV